VSEPRLAAIILAAGLSSRMGALKALLPLGPETTLARTVRLFKEAGCRDVIVVLGHESDKTAPEALAAGATPVKNPEYQQGMFTSVLAGVNALAPETGAFFVLPVDIPLVRPAVLDALRQALATAPQNIPAARPVFRGVPGHPPLFTRRAISVILNHDGQGGLAGALDKLPGGVLDVPVPDANILMDMDQPWDYLRILARLDRLEIPSKAECAAFLDDMPEKGRAHGRAVAARAVIMAQAINARRAPAERLDLELVRAAALLHDVAKGQPRHEAEGGRLLAAWGFDRTAAIVAAHKDPVPAEGEPVIEREVVAFADKLVRCHHPVSVEERFGEKLRLYADDPEAVAAITRRRDNALRVKARIEAEIGRSLEGLFSDET
jgi:molybdenum cofactor cytidylyltransferase